MAVAALAGSSLVGFQGLWVTMLAELSPPDRVGATTGFAITFTVTAVTLTPPVLGAGGRRDRDLPRDLGRARGAAGARVRSGHLVREPRDRLAG